MCEHVYKIYTLPTSKAMSRAQNEDTQTKAETAADL